MNRETRDKFDTRTNPDCVSGNACWETPPAVFKKLAKDFGPFDLDLTADPQRHLCRRWLGPGSTLAEDALTANWISLGKSGYSNPPYHGPFVRALLQEARHQQAKGFASTFLLRMAANVTFRTHILRGASELLFCDARIIFYENGAPRWNAKKLQQGLYVGDSAMFDSIIVRYLPGHEGLPLRVGEWNVPEHWWPPAKP